MHPADLEHLVRRVAQEVVRDELQALMDHWSRFPAPQPLPPQHRELLGALADVFTGQPFTSKEVLEIAPRTIGHRPRLAAALQALGADSAHGLGLELRRIVDARVGLIDAGKENGSRMWLIESGASGVKPRSRAAEPPSC